MAFGAAAVCSEGDVRFGFVRAHSLTIATRAMLDIPVAKAQRLARNMRVSLLAGVAVSVSVEPCMLR